MRLFRENEDQLTITASSCFGSRTPLLDTRASKARREMHGHSIRSTSQRKAVSSAVYLLDRKLESMPYQVPCATPQRVRGRARELTPVRRRRGGRCEMLPAQRVARYTRVRRMRLTLIRLELLASTLLLGVALGWSALRGLDLLGAIRPAFGPTAIGAAAGLALTASLPLVTAPWATRVLVLRGLRRSWDALQSTLGPDLRIREVLVLAL